MPEKSEYSIFIGDRFYSNLIQSWEWTQTLLQVWIVENSDTVASVLLAFSNSYIISILISFSAMATH
jgi:hypothetical protein